MRQLYTRVNCAARNGPQLFGDAHTLHGLEDQAYLVLLRTVLWCPAFAMAGRQITILTRK